MRAGKHRKDKPCFAGPEKKSIKTRIREIYESN
jgi:hypothetical protein